MVTAAAIASVAATAASSAMSATSSGPAGAQAVTPGLGERRARRRERDAYLAAANSVGSGAALSGRLDPYLFGLAGMDVQYTDRYGDWQQAQSEVDQTWDLINQTKADIQALKQQKRAAQGKRAKRAFKKQIRQRKKAARLARDNVTKLEQRAHRLATNPIEITDIKESDWIKASRANTEEIIGKMQERTLGALSGDVQDPRLLRELDAAENELRESLRRRFGSDYANTTPGRRALADFEQRRQESLSDAAMRDVRQLLPLAQQSEANMFQLAAGRGEMLRDIPRERLKWGQAFQSLGESWQSAAGQYQKDREMALRAQMANVAAGVGKEGAPTSTQRIAGAIGQIGGAISTATLAKTGFGAGAPAPTRAAPTITPSGQKAGAAATASAPVGVRSLSQAAYGGIKSGLGATRDFLLKY